MRALGCGSLWQECYTGAELPVPPPPFNYFANFAPGTPAPRRALRDGGLGGEAFLKDIDAGKLPAVTFYKPQGSLNEHAAMRMWPAATSIWPISSRIWKRARNGIICSSSSP